MLEHTDIFGGRPVVLIAHGDAGIRRQLSSALEHHGLTARTAADGAEAIRLYRKEAGQIAAVLLEERQAGMEGSADESPWQQLQPFVPICLLSDHVDEQRVEELRQRGVRYVFCRPFNVEGVAVLLQDIVNCTANELMASGVH